MTLYSQINDLATTNPEIAAEWHFETSENAPFILFGVLDDGEIKYEIEIPYALSFLVHSNPTAEVIGLDQIPVEEHPPDGR